MSVALLSMAVVLMRLASAGDMTAKKHEEPREPVDTTPKKTKKTYKLVHMTAEQFEERDIENDGFEHKENGIVEYQNALVEYINTNMKADQQRRFKAAFKLSQKCNSTVPTDMPQWADMCSDYVRHINRGEKVIKYWINDFNNMVIRQQNAVVHERSAFMEEKGLFNAMKHGILTNPTPEWKKLLSWKKSEIAGLEQLKVAITKYDQGPHKRRMGRNERHGQRILDECEKSAEFKCVDPIEAADECSEAPQFAVCEGMEKMNGREKKAREEWSDKINSVYVELKKKLFLEKGDIEKTN